MVRALSAGKADSATRIDNRESKGMSTRTPRELIEIYWDEVYNNCRTELIREVCADPIIRKTSRTEVESAGTE